VISILSLTALISTDRSGICASIDNKPVVEIIKEQFSCFPLRYKLSILVTLVFLLSTMSCYIFTIFGFLTTAFKKKNGSQPHEK
jgi:hypothetical protein